MARPNILIVAGHQAINDDGDPAEKALTPAIADRYTADLLATGWDVTRLPDQTFADLGAVGQAAHDWMQRTPGDLLMIDCHVEGAGPAQNGLFAIVPNRDALRTERPVQQAAADLWENNTLDQRLGRALCDQIRALTGMPLRTGIREEGLMDETETGVGGDGYRLAMYAFTSPFHYRAVRLVIEHGNLGSPTDRQIIDRPTFFPACASALLTALNQVYGN